MVVNESARRGEKLMQAHDPTGSFQLIPPARLLAAMSRLLLFLLRAPLPAQKYHKMNVLTQSFRNPSKMCSLPEGSSPHPLRCHARINDWSELMIQVLWITVTHVSRKNTCVYNSYRLSYEQCLIGI